ncbi:MAG: hypothetical protein ACRCZP_14265, partial [Phycicoccus sp.]
MMLPEVVGRLTADVEDFVRGWDRAADAAERNAARIRAANAAAGDGPQGGGGGYRDLDAEMQRLTRTVRLVSDQMRELGTVTRSTGQDVDQFGGRVREAGDGVESLGRRAREAGGGLGGLGGGAAGAGAGMSRLLPVALGIAAALPFASAGAL